MIYEATFRDKNAAWYVFKRFRDSARHFSTPNPVQIRDSTLFVQDSELPTLENMAEKIGAQYKIKSAEMSQAS